MGVASKHTFWKGSTGGVTGSRSLHPPAARLPRSRQAPRSVSYAAFSPRSRGKCRLSASGEWPCAPPGPTGGADDPQDGPLQDHPVLTEGTQPPSSYPGTKGKSGPLGAASRKVSSLEVGWHLGCQLAYSALPTQDVSEVGLLEPGQQPPMCMPSGADRGSQGDCLAPPCTTEGGRGREGCTCEGVWRDTGAPRPLCHLSAWHHRRWFVC